MKRLFHDSPRKDILVKQAHSDEVLHVSFSKTGKYFCTTSKDCNFKVWLVSNPVLPIISQSMVKVFRWKYTQYSEFNENDTMLLVSGVKNGTNNAGQIAIFDIPSFDLLTYVSNEPYDVFGCWFSEDAMLSGSLLWGSGWNSTSVVYLNHAIDSAQSRDHTIQRKLFRYDNHNGSSLRMLRVINFQRPLCLDANICICPSYPASPISCGRYLAFSAGSQTFMPHEFALKRVSSNIDSSSLPNHDNSLRGADLKIDLRGHLVGLAVDPEQMSVFLNVRRWPEDTVIDDPFQPPMPSTELEIRVVDLNSGKLLDAPIYRGHRAHTSEKNCFFIFLDVSRDFVASGAEESLCYLWDRHSAALLRRIEFANVVNCAAFLHNDNGGLLVSVSDDRSLKLSYSLRRFKTLPKKLRETKVTQLPPELE